jgi:hypothetical protein
MDAFEIKAKFPQIWEYMCLYSVSFDVAKDRLETEQSVKAFTQTQYNRTEEEYEEQTDELVEVDTEQKKEIVNHIINTILDSSLDREKQLQKVSELVKSYSRESEIILRLSSKYLEFLKLQKEDLERQSEDYHVAIEAFKNATNAFLELNKQAHETLERYNKLTIDFQRDYDNKVHDLNMRLNH